MSQNSSINFHTNRHKKQALLAYIFYLLTREIMTDSGPVASKMESNSKRIASFLVALCLGFFAILLTFDGSSSLGKNELDTTPKKGAGNFLDALLFGGGSSSKRRNQNHKSMSEEEKERLMQHVDFEIPKPSSSDNYDDDDDEDDFEDDDGGGGGGGRRSKTIMGKVSKKSRQYKKKRKQELMLRKKEQDLRQQAISSNPDDVVHGWIRAMFNQMDTNGDGKISLNEMKAYAEKMNLDRGYVQDFSEFVHIKAGEPENHDHPAVDFDHFLAALQQRDATVMRACAMGGYGGRSIFDEVVERSVWLLGLLVLQSLSGVVLQRYEQLLAEHVVIAVFLTMLVGAGGNAGNQSAIKIIEKIVLGEITVSIGSFLSEMHREIIVGMFLCVLVAFGGFVRAYITHGRARGGFLNVLALTCCLAVIVFSSTLIGVMLPFLLAKFGADPAHAGTVVQVVMDITGVIVTVTICSMMLPSVSKKTRTPAFAAVLERAFLAYFPENEGTGAPKEHRSDADLVMTSEKGTV